MAAASASVLRAECNRLALWPRSHDECTSYSSPRRRTYDSRLTKYSPPM
jgi:hypothetical protein